MNEKLKNEEINIRLESLFKELEDHTRLQQENEKIKQDLNNLQAEAQQDLEQLSEQYKHMEHEIFQLASRNANLQKDNEDLNRLLEESNFENATKTKHLDLAKIESMNRAHNGPLPSISNANLFSDIKDIQISRPYYKEDNDNHSDSGNIIDNQDQDLMNANNISNQDNNFEEQKLEIDNKLDHKKSPKKPNTKPMDNVPDVVREYLHLTASVVKMKFPKVQSLSSEELISKVKNLPFMEYHDHMIRIMKKRRIKIKNFRTRKIN